jgi:hypothetical protein
MKVKRDGLKRDGFNLKRWSTKRLAIKAVVDKADASVYSALSAVNLCLNTTKAKLACV